MKKSSYGHLLEHLEFFDTKIMMSEPVVSQFCEQRYRETMKETSKDLEDEFHVFFHT